MPSIIAPVPKPIATFILVNPSATLPRVDANLVPPIEDLANADSNFAAGPIVFENESGSFDICLDINPARAEPSSFCPPPIPPKPNPIPSMLDPIETACPKPPPIALPMYWPPIETAAPPTRDLTKPPPAICATPPRFIVLLFL